MATTPENAINLQRIETTIFKIEPQIEDKAYQAGDDLLTAICITRISRVESDHKMANGWWLDGSWSIRPRYGYMEPSLN